MELVCPLSEALGHKHVWHWARGDPASVPSYLPCRTKYSAFEPEGVLGNVLGLLLLAFGLAVLYTLVRRDWSRPAQEEERALSMDFKTLTEGDSPSPSQ